MRRMSLFMLLLVWPCVLGVVPSPHATAEDVAARTGWDRFVFSGNRTFSNEKILDALVRDVDFLMAAHSHSDVAAMPKIVQRLLIAGYRQTGFPDVTVHVVPDAQTRGATITIREGKRFRCGQVQVEGATQVDAERLIQRLSQPFPGKDALLSYEIVDGVRQPCWIDASGDSEDLEDPVWKQGEPVRFGAKDKLDKQLSDALRDLGFSQAKAEVKLVNDPEKATTAMVVRLKEEGEPDIVDEVVVEGLEKNSVERLLKFVGANRGMRADRQQIARITERLWSRGRFSELSVQRTKKPEGPLELKITVKEVPNVPLLDEAISAEAEAFLKARRWIAAATRRGDDLVFQVDADPWRMTFVQSKQGQIVHFAHTSDKAVDGQPKFGLFLFDHGQWLVCYSPTGVKYHGRLRMKDLKITVNTKLRAADDPEHLWVFGLRLGMSTDRAKDDPVIRLALTLHPSGFLPFAYKQNLSHAWEGNTLVSTRRMEDGTDDVIRIDKGTGAIDVRMTGTRLTFERGRFDRERRKIEERTKAFRNTYDKHRPVSTLVAYVCQSEIAEAVAGVPGSRIPQQRHFTSAMQKLAAGKVFQPLDRIVSAGKDPVDGELSRDDKFSIPISTPTDFGVRTPYEYLAGRFTVGIASRIFSEGSWPLRVAREIGCVAMARPDHTNEVLREIHTDAKYGPICHATVALLLSRVELKLAATFAKRGLEQLNAESFDRDYRDLCTGEFGQWMSHTIVAFRSLSSEELESLVGIVEDDRVSGMLRYIHSAAKKGADTDDGVLHFDDVKEELESWLRSMTK